MGLEDLKDNQEREKMRWDNTYLILKLSDIDSWEFWKNDIRKFIQKYLLEYSKKRLIKVNWSAQKNDSLKFWNQDQLSLLNSYELDQRLQIKGEEKEFDNEEISNVFTRIIEKYLRERKLSFKDIVNSEINSWILSLKIRWQELPILIDITQEKIEGIFLQISQTSYKISDLKEQVSLVNLSLWIWWVSAMLWQQWPEAVWYILRRVKIEWLGYVDIQWNFSTLSDMESAIFREFDMRWIELNEKGDGFVIKEPVTPKTIEKTLKEYTYEQYKERVNKLWINREDVWSPEEFEKSKNTANERIYSLHEEYLQSTNKLGGFEKFFLSRYSNLLAEIWWEALHFIMLPVFFQAAHKNSQDLWAILDSTWEVIWFTYGAKLWSKIPWFVVVKLFSWLAAGMWTVVMGKYGAEKLFEVDKNFTKYFPNREDFLEKLGNSSDDKRSFLLHLGTSFWLYEFSDTIWMDIWLYNTNITLNQHDIDLSTDPRIYLGLGYVRDWKFRNERIEDFKKKLVPEIKKSFFTRDSILWKKRLRTPFEFSKPDFRKQIYEILVSKNPEDMTPYHKEIIERIVNYIVNLAPKTIPWEASFDSLIQNLFVQIDKLQIYPSLLWLSYLDKYKEWNDTEELLIQESLNWNSDLANTLNLEEDLKFISQLPKEQRKFIKDKIFKSILEKIPLDFSSQEKKMWFNLMEEKYFYTGNLSSTDKKNIIKIYREEFLPIYGYENVISKRQEYLWFKDWKWQKSDERAINVFLMEKLLDQPIIDLESSSISPLEKSFLSSIMTWKWWLFQMLAHPKEKNECNDWVHQWKKDYSEFLQKIGKTTHWGNIFYKFFNRSINLKRKIDFYRNMAEFWLPHKIQSPSDVWGNILHSLDNVDW